LPALLSGSRRVRESPQVIVFLFGEFLHRVPRLVNDGGAFRRSPHSMRAVADNLSVYDNKKIAVRCFYDAARREN
jgi:hypothetical protein